MSEKTLSATARLKPQISWLRVFVEGVVIVGSILLAFGIDAWWEGRQERDEEVQVLLAIQEDIELNRKTKHSIDIVVDRVIVKPDARPRIADAVDADMYAAIDALADKLDRQLKRHKEKNTDRYRSARGNKTVTQNK